ncbi:glutathione S-transferase [Apiospora saccharicola]
MAAQNTDIHLYTTQTPNGINISILLEELGLKYQVRKHVLVYLQRDPGWSLLKTTTVEITKNTQKEPWFLEINTSGRIPALTDTKEDGQTVKLFESGSIMQYLVDRYDKDHRVSYPYGSREHWEVNNWLFWQMGGLGPMQGTASSGTGTRPVVSTGVMETQLQKSCSGYLVGDRCTVADISCWGWVAAAAGSGADIAEFPVLKEWRDKLLARTAVEKGRHVPSPHTVLEYYKLSEEELKKKFEGASKWIQASMKEDSK